MKHIPDDPRRPVAHTHSWGYHETLDHRPDYTIRRIVITERKRFIGPDRRFSHGRWLVLFGELEGRIGDLAFKMSKGDSVEIPPGQNHSARNIGTDLAAILEIIIT